MKTFRLVALGAFFITLGLRFLHAQEEGQQQGDEIITDFGIDDLIYAPKFTLSFGVRALSGAKSTFAGHGIVSSVQPGSDATTPNLQRFYNEGVVVADTRTVIDSDGNTTPITPDGYTNTWNYNYAGQVTPDGYIAFHAYTADAGDPGVQNNRARVSEGTEVMVSRDMGHLGKKFSWTLFAGVSLNDLNSTKLENLPATLTTITDYYSLNGQVPPPAPYSAPTNATNSTVASDGSYLTTSTDTSVLISNHPVQRVTTVTTGVVSNRWRVKGGYFTFRAGPSMTYAITDKLRATLSVGASLVFSGSTYEVDEVYVPDVGPDVIKAVEDTTEKLLPGYYADATLEYAITDRTGAYAGAVYQANGSYVQNISAQDASYTTKVDLTSLQGFRMGMNFRF